MTKKPTKKPIKKPVTKKPAVETVAPEPKPVDPYHSEFDGTYTMKDHDEEASALKRWFDNFKVDRYVSFATEYECLIVEEVPASAKHIKKKQICRIENAGANTTREVRMDHTAPPAPMVFFAAKRQYVPPPPKTPAELRREEEWHRMRSMGYVPRYRNVPIRKVNRMSVFDFDPEAGPLKLEMTTEFVEEIEWVRDDRPLYYDMSSSASAASPPAPRYRRN